MPDGSDVRLLRSYGTPRRSEAQRATGPLLALADGRLLGADYGPYPQTRFGALYELTPA
jgi:hypothetical protein